MTRRKCSCWLVYTRYPAEYPSPRSLRIDVMMFDAESRVCLRTHQSGHARQGPSVAPASARFGDCRINFLAKLRINDSSTAHTITYAAVALSIARRIPSSPTLNRRTNVKMVPKPQGQAMQSVTHRPLPPLPKLRVRRPNKPETNPCLGAMSSVLGRCSLIPVAGSIDGRGGAEG
jgi:hypothetical protein